jgi:hypothetical protein
VEKRGGGDWKQPFRGGGIGKERGRRQKRKKGDKEGKARQEKGRGRGNDQEKEERKGKQRTHSGRGKREPGSPKRG